MKGFVCKEFVHDVEPDWKPMELHEAVGDVLPGFSASQNPGRRVLYVLEHIQGFAGHHEQDSITVVQLGRTDERLHHRVCERGGGVGQC